MSDIHRQCIQEAPDCARFAVQDAEPRYPEPLATGTDDLPRLDPQECIGDCGMGADMLAVADLLVEATAGGGMSPYEDYRSLRYLLDELRRLGPEAKHRVAPIAIAGLVQLLVRGTVGQSWRSTVVLRHLGPAAHDAIPALIEAFHTRDGEGAYRALLAQNPDPAVVVSALIQALVQGRSNFGRAATVSALEQFGPLAEPAIPALLGLLKYRRLRIRFAAADALLAIGPAGVRALAEAAQAAASPVVRANAGKTLEVLEKGRIRHRNPRRTLVRIEPQWLAWNNGTVLRLASAARVDGSPAMASILADALEEAGCTDCFFLAHLRLPMPHTPGCFAVRVILASARANSHAARFRAAGADWYDSLAAHEQEEADAEADECSQWVYARPFSCLTGSSARRVTRLVRQHFEVLLQR